MRRDVDKNGCCRVPSKQYIDDISVNIHIPSLFFLSCFFFSTIFVLLRSTLFLLGFTVSNFLDYD